MLRTLALFLCLLLATPVAAKAPMPFELGGPFSLTNDKGETRTQTNPHGLPQLLFFGYANCQQICSVALPLMADVAQTLAAAKAPVTPIMITVDPERDKVGNMSRILHALHPDFTGLTGTPEALSAAYKAFSVEHEKLFDDPLEGPVYSHGSFIYLLDADGTFLTLFPPILSVEKAAEIVSNYIVPSN